MDVYDGQHLFCLFQVKVVTLTPSVAFDAVELLSMSNSDTCSGCHPIKYRLSRTPALPNGDILLEDS